MEDIINPILQTKEVHHKERPWLVPDSSFIQH